MADFLENIGSISSGTGAEITAFDPASQQLFTVAGGTTLDLIDLSNPAAPSLTTSIDLTQFLPDVGGANSLAVSNGTLAIALEATDATSAGVVLLLNLNNLDTGSPDTLFNGARIVPVGSLPDMATFTPDGSRLLVANEGEPSADYLVDPEGSISIIDVASGTVTTAGFQGFNDQKAALINAGVRIFGPNATVSQDLEPEYIAVSPDGNTAFVTLQENNAFAVVDIATSTVTDLIPLGTKDFSRGLPELTTYDLPNRGALSNGANGTILDGLITTGDALQTSTGETIELGGFSGLWYDGPLPDGKLQFLAIPDRGPLGDALDLDGDGITESQSFLLPETQARIVRLAFDPAAGTLDMTGELMLTRRDTSDPITGLPNIPNVDPAAVDASGNPVDLPQLTILDAQQFGADYDPFGADFEGILRAPDNSYWMVDEYRPAIYNFDVGGRLREIYVPQGTEALAEAANPGIDFAPGQFGNELLPAEYLNRGENQGFEAIALDADNNVIYSFLQTPLNNPDTAAGDESTVIRILGIDASNGQPVAEYIYLLRDSQPGDNIDKIGDAVYAGDGKFYVLERDASLAGDTQTVVFEIDITGATNVLGRDFGSETLEQQTPEALATAGINPVIKTQVANLDSLGYGPADTAEGLALLPDGSLAILNDNSFGRVPGEESVQLGVIRFTGENGLDASDRDGIISIQNQPVQSFYQPDAIASYSANGQTYYVTANEGDARDYDGFSEETRVSDLILDPNSYPDAATVQADANLGRLTVSTVDGDFDGDGDVDQIYGYGGRSFSIWDSNGNQVYDSGSDIATTTAQLFPELFNSQGDTDSFDSRSDNKGAEPEAITIGEVDGQTIAFIGLERTGGIISYDITDPSAPSFISYTRTEGDIAPEGITFIPSTSSPNGRDTLVVANEGSGTVSLFDVGGTGPIVNPSDSNILGSSSVFLNGEPGNLLTEETNLGNLIADANLAAAQQVDPTTTISLQLADGINGSIGQIIPGADGETPQFLPNEEIPGVRPAGGISQTDIERILPDNNGLSIATVTASQLSDILEFTLADLDDTGAATQGNFAQVAGIEYSFAPNDPVGDRLQSVAVLNSDGTDADVIINNGELQGDPNRTFRIVAPDSVLTGAIDIQSLLQPDDAVRTGAATFAPDGSEQDALAEFLAANTDASNPLNTEDTGPARDTRAQNILFREDTVIDDRTNNGGNGDDGNNNGGNTTKTTLKFEDVEGVPLAAGDIITNQYDGLTISTPFNQFGAMIFDSANPTGEDFDLRTSDQGNVLIISEDGDANDPDDNADGGTLRFEWDSPVDLAEIGILDVDRDGSVINLFAEDGSLIKTVVIPSTGDNGQVTLDLDASGVARMDVVFEISGAVTCLTVCEPSAGSGGNNDSNGGNDSSSSNSNDNSGSGNGNDNGGSNSNSGSTDDLLIGLYDAGTDQLIRILEDGDSLSASSIRNLNDVNIGAVIPNDSSLFTQVASAQVLLNGEAGTAYFEGAAPYALFGDARGDFFQGSIPTGQHTVAFELYSEFGGQGDLITTVERNFTIV